MSLAEGSRILREQAEDIAGDNFDLGEVEVRSVDVARGLIGVRIRMGRIATSGIEVDQLHIVGLDGVLGGDINNADTPPLGGTLLGDSSLVHVGDGFHREAMARVKGDKLFEIRVRPGCTPAELAEMRLAHTTNKALRYARFPGWLAELIAGLDWTYEDLKVAVEHLHENGGSSGSLDIVDEKTQSLAKFIEPKMRAWDVSAEDMYRIVMSHNMPEDLRRMVRDRGKGVPGLTYARASDVHKKLGDWPEAMLEVARSIDLRQLDRTQSLDLIEYARTRLGSKRDIEELKRLCSDFLEELEPTIPAPRKRTYAARGSSGRSTRRGGAGESTTAIPDDVARMSGMVLRLLDGAELEETELTEIRKIAEGYADSSSRADGDADNGDRQLNASLRAGMNNLLIWLVEDALISDEELRVLQRSSDPEDRREAAQIARARQTFADALRIRSTSREGVRTTNEFRDTYRGMGPEFMNRVSEAGIDVLATKHGINAVDVLFIASRARSSR